MKIDFKKKNKKFKRCLLLSSCLCFLLVCNGCAPIEKLQQWKADQTQAAKGEQQASGNQLYLENRKPTAVNEGATAGETVEISLYFTDEKGEALTVEKRVIGKEEGIARATVNALLDGPENQELKAVVPAGTRLRDINIKEDGCCVVDFSKEIIDNQLKESNGEMVTVAAIVQTLGQFSSVKEVQILVDGKVVSSLGGQVDVSLPISTEN